MIELSNLVKRYGGETAVGGVNLRVEKGELCVLIGPSGCGKSTTLKMINRMIEPTEGNILINGDDVRSHKPEVLRRGIGYVIQSVGLFPHMSVRDNIAVVPRLLKWDEERIDGKINSLLELVELGNDYAEKHPRQLSGGEAQRVGVARALAADPEILLMDEPFGALDPVTRESLQTSLLRIQQKLKKTVVFVTHDIDEAVRLASKIALMRDGKIVQYDTPQNILSAPADKFTARFVGNDRALKNLTRIAVKDVLEPAVTVKESVSTAEAAKLFGDKVYLWVTDSRGVFIGWLSSKDIDVGSGMSDNMFCSDYRDFSVSPDSSLRDALSKQVMHGVFVIPVTEKGEVVGEISLQRIMETGSA